MSDKILNARISKQGHCLEGSVQQQGHYLEGSVSQQGKNSDTFYGNAGESSDPSNSLHANVEEYYHKPKEAKPYTGQAEIQSVRDPYAQFLRQDGSYDLRLMQGAQGSFVAGFIRLYQEYPRVVSSYHPFYGQETHVEKSLHTSSYALSIPVGLPDNSRVSGRFKTSSSTKDGNLGDDSVAGTIVFDQYSGCRYFYGTIVQRYEKVESPHQVWIPLTREFSQGAQVRQALGGFDRAYMLEPDPAYQNKMNDPADDRLRHRYPRFYNQFEMPGIIAPSYKMRAY